MSEYINTFYRIFLPSSYRGNIKMSTFVASLRFNFKIQARSTKITFPVGNVLHI